MKFKFVFFALIANIILFFIHPEMARASLINSFQFSIEVLKMLPPILILISLLDVWTSREQIETHLGSKSGAKGIFLSLLMGSASAGPLFSAFPIASSLTKKGVRTANIVIFLGSWATIKIPMLIMESGFLGMRFALLRFVITVPFILGIGYFVEKWHDLD
jgi:uncharacterized membrane protein YraQ (UPF0718 family)